MEKIICSTCKTVSLRHPSHINKTHNFCNMKCRSEYYRVSDIKCNGCGKQILKKPKKTGKQYCTWSCFKSSRHIEVQCDVCKKSFSTYLCEELKRQDRQHIHCCSRSCRNTYTSFLLGGDGNWTPGGAYNPKRNRGYHWRKIRLQYLRAVNWLCEGCQGTKAIIVHHLNPVAHGGDLLSFDNLMAVCKECHENMHEQLRSGAFWCSLEARENTHS